MIEDKVDILVVSETKLDSTFLTSQFYVNSFAKAYRFARKKNSEGALI